MKIGIIVTQVCFLGVNRNGELWGLTFLLFWHFNLSNIDNLELNIDIPIPFIFFDVVDHIK